MIARNFRFILFGVLVAVALVVTLVVLIATPGNSPSFVTYDRVGTFARNDFYELPWRPLLLLPDSPEKLRPTFTLYTRAEKDQGKELDYFNRTSVRNTTFAADNPTKFIVHGFVDNTDIGDWLVDLKNGWLKRANVNVIIVDWRRGNFFPYLQSTANTRVIGRMIAVLIGDLVDVTGAKPEEFHVIGHSLGSHIAGYAGKWMNGSLGRITGLDPAGPLFEGISAQDGKLQPTDARFVDVIHTDLMVDSIGFGNSEALGHVDIYPNGGWTQPGCKVERWTTVFTDGLLEGARRFGACNHQRAIDFYTAALEDISGELDTLGRECSDWQSFKNGSCSECGGRQGKYCAPLGPLIEEWVSKYEPGIGSRKFYMKTTDDKPYFATK